jgi:hypothetical protein
VQKLQYHVLNKGTGRLYPREAGPLTAYHRIVQVFRGGAVPQDLQNFYAGQRIGIGMKFGPDFAEFTLAHLEHKNPYIKGIIAWGKPQAVQKAYSRLFSEYMAALTEDIDGHDIPECAAHGDMPDTIPFVAAVYLAPHYRLAAMNPSYANSIESYLINHAWATVEAVLNSPKA